MVNLMLVSRLKSAVEIGHVVYIFSSTLKISNRIFNRQLSVSISASSFIHLR
ncbi:hypothetical protein Hanom_Chr02g00141761 [Helianthus anomalus]